MQKGASLLSKVIGATAPCSWGVWYADGTPSGTPYEIFLDQAASAGYKALELGPDGYLPTDKDVLRKELSERGLSICAGTACYAFDQYACFADFKGQVEALCERISAFGAKYLVTMDESDVGLYSEKKKDYTSETWKKYLTMFRDMGRFTKEQFGIETVYHPHIKSLIETEEEIIRMMDFTGLNLCFDIGHHAYVNGDGKHGDASALDFIRKYADRIVYLHFKNIDYDVFQKVTAENIDSDTAFDIGVMCGLEEGIVDYVELKKLLDEIGFDGIGVIEQDVPKATTQEAFDLAKRNLEYLTKIGMIKQERGM